MSCSINGIMKSSAFFSARSHAFQVSIYGQKERESICYRREELLVRERRKRSNIRIAQFKIWSDCSKFSKDSFELLTSIDFDLFERNWFSWYFPIWRCCNTFHSVNRETRKENVYQRTVHRFLLWEFLHWPLDFLLLFQEGHCVQSGRTWRHIVLHRASGWDWISASQVHRWQQLSASSSHWQQRTIWAFLFYETDSNTILICVFLRHRFLTAEGTWIDHQYEKKCVFNRRRRKVKLLCLASKEVHLILVSFCNLLKSFYELFGQ